MIGTHDSAHSSLSLPLSLCAVAIYVKSREEPLLASVLIWDWPRGCDGEAGEAPLFFAIAKLSAATQLSPFCSCRALAKPLRRFLWVLVLEPWHTGALLRGIAPSGEVCHSPAFLAAVIRAISILSSSVFRGGRFASGG